MRCLSLLLVLAGLQSCGSAPPPPPPEPAPVDPGATNPAEQNTARRSAAQPRLSRLPNGLTVALLPHHRGDFSQIQIGLLAGSDFAAPGLAELAAEVLVGSADATGGRISARQSIERLGGTLTIEVNPLTTWITVRVPQFRWAQAQAALAAALTAPTLSRSQIGRVRDEYVLRRIREVWQMPSREVPRAFLLGNLGTSPYIASLLDRDPSEVTLFMARLYRTESTFVTLSVPANDARIRELLDEGLAKWPAPTTARAEVKAEPKRLESGIYWAPSDPPQACRAMLVLPLPDDASPQAAEVFTVHACMTLDGIGGRLEGLQQQEGLGHLTWRTEILDLADTPAIVLTTEMTPAEAVKMWDVVGAARQSLLHLPPTPSELQLALRRAQLTAQLLSEHSDSRGRISAWRATQGRAADALDQRFAALEKPGALNVRLATLSYLRLPTAMIVLGGRAPEGYAEHRTFELLPPGAMARLVSDDPVVQSEAATPWLNRAIEAIGGKDVLQRFNGFASAATLRGEGAPPATEQLRWDRTTGRIDRQRDVLGTAIETAISTQSATEQSGDTKLAIPRKEVALLRRELARHPISLLAACARGQLRFRPVAQRTVGDRDLMILEAIGDDFDRLRVHIDTVSHLIRVVEVWETSLDGTVFHLRDAWSDYRNVASALRAPFRRLTDHDDGRNRIEAVFSRWEPTLLPK